MSLTGNKIKKDLRSQILKDREGGKNKDLRFLNYYDLEPNSSMKIVLLPDGADTGDLYVTYRTHSIRDNNLRVGSVVCPRVGPLNECPACQRSYEAYQAGDKETAKLYRSKDHHLGQCVVLESPIEINDTPDNIVKLFNITFSLKNKIEEGIVEQIVEDATEHAFVIKNVKNRGGFNDYSNSHYRPEPLQVTPEIESALEEGRVQPYNLHEEIPPKSTYSDVEEWLVKVDSALNGVAASEPQPATATHYTAPVEPEETAQSSVENTPPSGGINDLRSRIRQRRLQQ